MGLDFHAIQPSGADVPNSSAELLPLLYTELRQLAAQKLSHVNPGQNCEPEGAPVKPSDESSVPSHAGFPAGAGGSAGTLSRLVAVPLSPIHAAWALTPLTGAQTFSINPPARRCATKTVIHRHSNA